MIDVNAMPYLADIVRYQAKTRPDETALWFENHETSYAELNTRSNAVANGLIAAGVKPNDRVAYLGKNLDVYYEMLFGTNKSRACLLYTSPSPRDATLSRMPSSA